VDFPKRTKQQKSEASSYAILLYKLRDLGIFRNLTDNDYGIDFELELVNGEIVTGKTLKIQVKSAEALKLDKDKRPSVGGVKQTTLSYWCELSYRTNVIAYAVDLATEKIYVSDGLFWQATQKIDGSEASKSIRFLSTSANSDQTTKALTTLFTIAPTAADHVYAHTLALRRLQDFLELLGDAFQYDHGHQLDGVVFQDLFDVSRILLWEVGHTLWKEAEDRREWSNYEYWRQKSIDDNWDGLVCHTAKPILKKLIPALIESMEAYRVMILAGKYYWSHRNPEFLKLVYETPLPVNRDIDHLRTWFDTFDHYRHSRSVMDSYSFLRQAREPKIPKKKNAKTKKKGK